MNAIRIAIERWKREDLVLLPPIEESVVAARLSSLGRRYSRDVLALYQLTGGMDDNVSDSHMWSLWSFDKVIAETRRYTRPYILFADFLIESHLYCFKYEDEERSSVAIEYLTGEEPEVVAGSVEEFFEMFNTEAAKLGMLE